MHSSIIICHFSIQHLVCVCVLCGALAQNFSVICSCAENRKEWLCWILMKSMRGSQLARTVSVRVRHHPAMLVTTNNKTEKKRNLNWHILCELNSMMIWFANKLFNKNCWNVNVILFHFTWMGPHNNYHHLWNNELSETFQLNDGNFCFDMTSPSLAMIAVTDTSTIFDRNGLKRVM